MFKVAFRLDADTNIGTGHLMRCLTLAEELGRRGGDCAFYCNPLTPALRALIFEAGHRYVALTPGSRLGESPPAPWCDWLVFDHYGLAQHDEDLAGQHAQRRLVIDDLADRAHRCDLLLDQSPHRTPTDYQLLVNAECRLLLGAEFALLRTEFREQRHTRPERWKHGLICFGGADPTGASLLTLKSVARHDDLRRLHWTVVTGAANRDHDKIAQWIKTSGMTVTLIHQSNSIAALMATHDFAIGAAGGMVLERACVGLPALAVVVAPNQHVAAKAITSLGVGLMIDEAQLHDPLSLAAHLQRLQQDATRFTERGRQLVDGRGTERVVDRMLTGITPLPQQGRPHEH